MTEQEVISFATTTLNAARRATDPDRRAQLAGDVQRLVQDHCINPSTLGTTSQELHDLSVAGLAA